MSIIVKGMEMPKNCRECPFGEFEDAVWYACSTLCLSFKNPGGEYKADSCPLVELPEKHGRLIDGDYLYSRFKSNGCHDENVYRFIKEEPTVIEAEEGGQDESG